MCKDNKIFKVLKEGVKIDAKFPRNMELAYEILLREGYNRKKDFLYITTQCDDHFSVLKYKKSIEWPEGKTGEKSIGRHFTLSVPDRYIPSKKTEKEDGVIRTDDDIDELFEELLSENEES